MGHGNAVRWAGAPMLAPLSAGAPYAAPNAGENTLPCALWSASSSCTALSVG